MPDFITHCNLPFLIAQIAGGAPAPATGSAPSTVVYWIALVLVTAGLAIVGIVLARVFRDRHAAESEGVPEAAAYTSAAPVPTPERVAPTPAPRFVAPAQPSPTTIEAQNLLRLMGEAEELCSRLGRELDDKAERLERLLARAEGRLGAAMPPAPAAPHAPHPLHNAPAATPPAAPVSPQSRPEIVTRPIAVPAPAMAAAPSVPSLYYAPPATAPSQAAVQASVAPQQVPAPSFTAAPKRTADPFGLDPLTRDIYTLADAGHSASAIAQQLGQHTGKVELILALRSA
jgi:hypothetical protein